MIYINGLKVPGVVVTTSQQESENFNLFPIVKAVDDYGGENLETYVYLFPVLRSYYTEPTFESSSSNVPPYMAYSDSSTSYNTTYCPVYKEVEIEGKKVLGILNDSFGYFWVSNVRGEALKRKDVDTTINYKVFNLTTNEIQERSIIIIHQVGQAVTPASNRYAYQKFWFTLIKSADEVIISMEAVS